MNCSSWYLAASSLMRYFGFDVTTRIALNKHPNAYFEYKERGFWKEHG